MRFLSTLASFGIERLLGAANLLVTAILVGRCFSAEQAATYFFSSAAAQVVVSPWIAGAETAWLGIGTAHLCPIRLHHAAQKHAFISALLVLPILVIYISSISGPIWIGVLSLASQVAYSAILRQIEVRFDRPGRYVRLMFFVNVAAISMKGAALIGLIHGDCSLAVVFSEYLIAAAVCFFLPSGRTNQSSAGRVELRKQVSATLGVAIVLLSQKMIVWIAGAKLSPEQFAPFGLAYSVVGAASIAGQALSAATLATLRKQRSASFIIVRSAWSAMLLSVVAVVGIFTIGESLLTGIVGFRGQHVYEFVRMQSPMILAILITGCTWSVAVSLEKTARYAGAGLLGSLLAAAVFWVAPTSASVWLWSGFQAAWAVAVFVFSAAAVRGSDTAHHVSPTHQVQPDR